MGACAFAPLSWWEFKFHGSIIIATRGLYEQSRPPHPFRFSGLIPIAGRQHLGMYYSMAQCLESWDAPNRQMHFLKIWEAGVKLKHSKDISAQHTFPDDLRYVTGATLRSCKTTIPIVPGIVIIGNRCCHQPPSSSDCLHPAFLCPEFSKSIFPKAAAVTVSPGLGKFKHSTCLG